jgi:hypothetical protein
VRAGDGTRVDRVRRVRTELLDVVYHEAVPRDGDVVVLLHGNPLRHPQLSATSRRPSPATASGVIVPYLGWHGPTHFLDPAVPRSG